ncbi:MAG: DNA repair protein RecN [Deltaproteobacteria bacterium]|nr:DNA repair protein RecN [Deltaproteobacteria bacterium]
MLHTLRVSSFAIIDEVELELGPGLNVITGETGAGKSLLVGAMSLLLGGRARSELVREGAEQAVVEALFVPGSEAESRALDAVLEAHGLPPAEGELLIRRVVPREGKGKVYLGGALATARILQAVVGPLVELCGQHEHTRLKEPAHQGAYLDAFAAGAIAGFPAQVEAWGRAHQALELARAELLQLEEGLTRRAEREAFLAHQIKEVARLAPEPGELERLEAERKVLRHAQALGEAAGGAEELLYSGEASAVESLGRALGLLEGVARHDPRIQALLPGISEALTLVEEHGRDLQGYREGLEADPERLEAHEERLADLRGLVRKHGGDLDQVLEAEAGWRAELEGFEHHEERLEDARRALELARSRAATVAGELGELRRKAARKLQREARATLDRLGMEKQRLRIEVLPTGQLGPRGGDEVRLSLAEGSDGTGLPLSRVGSGGELSRLLLALRAVRADEVAAPSLIFDEVDSGVGGAVADAVGGELSALGRRRQVICVTHLPQVAAHGDRHLRVGRAAGEGKARPGRVEVHTLSPKEQAEELARMLGGLEVTRRARAHAKEMLDRARGGRAAA